MNNNLYHMYYIYLITNTVNSKKYIGQHKMSKTKESFYRYMGNGIALKQAFKKYGKQNFTKEILEYIPDTEKHYFVSQREIYWIQKLGTMHPEGYNISPGGEGGITSEIAQKSANTRKLKGYKHSKETKQKISRSNKGVTKSNIHKQHLSDNHHLKTVHTIIFKDGHVEDTMESLDKIAKRFGISGQSMLIRYSAKQKFIKGIYLLGISKDRYACTKSYRSPKNDLLCRDPVKKDICRYQALCTRARSGKDKEKYEGLDLNKFIIKGE